MSKKVEKNKIEKKETERVSFPITPMEPSGMRLFADDYSSGAASATECTGLVQIAPADDDIMEAYEQIYSYRQSEPIIQEE